MTMEIRGIIFDLGHTLIRLTRPEAEIMHEGAEAMATYLKKKRLKIDVPLLIETFIAGVNAERKEADKTRVEVQAQNCLLRTLNEMDVSQPPHAVVEAAIKIFFAPQEEAWHSYPDAVETLKQLQPHYRVGLYSNYYDDGFIQRIINRRRLRPWLSPTLSSAACGWRKPKPEPFALIAERWGLAPEKIVVVGDNLEADIQGAQRAGMSSILMTMDEHITNEAHRHIQPTTTAAQLSDLPDLIDKLS